MAEQAAGTVATAVIGGITERALTTVMRKLRSGPAAAHEKLQRLETLVLKLRCAVEVSEKHAIGSASLLEWRDRLREAAEEGGAVVLDFQRRARAREEENGGEAASTSTSTSTPGCQHQQQQPAAGALYFTRSALSGMAQRVRDVTRRLFSIDEDTKKLDGALEKMERFSSDITQFLMALQLEVSLEQRRQAAKRWELPPLPAERIKRRRESKGDDEPDARDASLYLPEHFSFRKLGPLQLTSPSGCSVQSTHLWDSEHISRKAVTSSETTRLSSAEAEEAEEREMEARMLARVLEPSLPIMDSFIEATEGRDMGGLVWLAEWAALLREAVERGNAVLRTLFPGSDVIHKAGGAALEEGGEVYSFARAVEWLAREEPSFPVLVKLLP